jgi:pimeloyl-ACP methyl ester carboxylesterase
VNEPVAVVFIHGIGGGARMWTPQLRSFAVARFAPVALDLPGYGARPPVDAMTFEELAADVEAEIARQKLDRPVLIGHSMGGMVVQTMLRRKPNGYRAAVLSATSPAFGDAAGAFQRQFVAERLAPLDAGKTMKDMAPGMVDGMVGPGISAANRAFATEIMSAASERTYRAAVQCLVTFDERANLGAIRVPVLCLAGEHDRNAPAKTMERMAGKIPGARYVCLPGVGHIANLEAMAFDVAIFEFLDHALARAMARR